MEALTNAIPHTRIWGQLNAIIKTEMKVKNCSIEDLFVKLIEDKRVPPGPPAIAVKIRQRMR